MPEERYCVLRLLGSQAFFNRGVGALILHYSSPVFVGHGFSLTLWCSKTCWMLSSRGNGGWADICLNQLWPQDFLLERFLCNVRRPISFKSFPDISSICAYQFLTGHLRCSFEPRWATLAIFLDKFLPGVEKQSSALIQEPSLIFSFESKSSNHSLSNIEDVCNSGGGG